MIHYHCACGTFYELNEELSGREVECYKCGRKGIAEKKAASTHHPHKDSPIYVLEPPLIPISALLSQAWELYKKRFGVYIGILAVGLVSSLLVLFGLMGLGTVLSAILPFLHGLMILLSTVLAVLGSVYTVALTQSALLQGIMDSSLGIKGAFKRARPKTLSFVWVLILLTFIISGGHLLLFIPGVMFMVWFAFTPFVVLTEDLKGMNALLKSKAYVRGRWFSTAFRLLIISLAAFFLFLIPFLGTILEFFFIPFAFIFLFLLFENLKSTRANKKFEAKMRTKVGIMGTAMLGYLFFSFVLTVMFSIALFKIVSKLREQARSEGAEAVFIQHRNTVLEQLKSKLFLSPGQSSIQERFEDDLDTLEDPTKDVISERWPAAKRLEESQDPRIVEPFIRLLRSDSEKILREQAAKVLGRLGDPRAIEPLKEVLEDESFAMVITPDGTMTKIRPVSDAASIALRKMGESDIPVSDYTLHLIQELKNKNPDVQLKAISALQRREDPASIKPLKVLLKSSNRSVAKSAREALKAIEKQ